MTPKREIGIEAVPRGYKDIIDRQLVRDARLSLRALGLAVRLLSNAPGFKMTSIDLARERPEGRDAIRAALKELEAARYLRRLVSQLPNGHWVTQMIITDELPPAPENASSEPTPGKPGVGTTGVKSSKSTTSKNSNRKSTTTAALDLFWPSALTTAEKAVVENVIHSLEPEVQQQLVDELAGALRSPMPPRQLTSWMLALRARQQRGEFFPNLGLAIEQERCRHAAETIEQQKRHELRERSNSPEARARSKAAFQIAMAEISRGLEGLSSESSA